MAWASWFQRTYDEWNKNEKLNAKEINQDNESSARKKEKKSAVNMLCDDCAGDKRN